jgi:hypothetical protein
MEDTLEATRAVRLWHGPRAPRYYWLSALPSGAPPTSCMQGSKVTFLRANLASLATSSFELTLTKWGHHPRGHSLSLAHFVATPSFTMPLFVNAILQSQQVFAPPIAPFTCNDIEERPIAIKSNPRCPSSLYKQYCCIAKH